METALTTTGSPVIHVDLSKLDRKQIRYLKSMRDRDDLLKVTGQVLDVGKTVITKTGELAVKLSEHELLAYAAGMILVYNLMRMKLLDPITAAVINAGLVTAAGLEAVLPDWLT